MKKEYVFPEIEIIRFEISDIIATSLTPNMSADENTDSIDGF